MPTPQNTAFLTPPGIAGLLLSHIKHPVEGLLSPVRSLQQLLSPLLTTTEACASFTHCQSGSECHPATLPPSSHRSILPCASTCLEFRDLEIQRATCHASPLAQAPLANNKSKITRWNFAASSGLLRYWVIWFWCASLLLITASSSASAKSPSNACSGELLAI
ncbi:hypothetical protein CA85_01750 [Allorhodopirellula solitaria]|uniref:Uncharacterized protein n=1 Tax=Allorhodopirellula solitaria TaxID=2527987 RepID=A0A5C5YJ59_9BACT|nr:hypothetical protein CA85_01750 [Allorhodopirellula solitaria]